MQQVKQLKRCRRDGGVDKEKQAGGYNIPVVFVSRIQ